MCTSAMITEGLAYSSGAGGMPMAFRVELTIPWSSRIRLHPYVRAMTLVMSGAKTTKRPTYRQILLLTLCSAQAVGTAMIDAVTVTMAEISSVSPMALSR